MQYILPTGAGIVACQDGPRDHPNSQLVKEGKTAPIETKRNLVLIPVVLS